jgi:hypothetical protein
VTTFTTVIGLGARAARDGEQALPRQLPQLRSANRTRACIRSTSACPACRPPTLPLLARGAHRDRTRGNIQLVSRFVRKNYFTLTCPRAIRSASMRSRSVLGGAVPFGDGRHCRLHRIHIEEDAGKLTHTDLGTLVDSTAPASRLSRS